MIFPGMIERKRGHVINISSVAGFQAYKNGSFYCASAFLPAMRQQGFGTIINIVSDAGLTANALPVRRYSRICRAEVAGKTYSMVDAARHQHPQTSGAANEAGALDLERRPAQLEQRWTPESG